VAIDDDVSDVEQQLRGPVLPDGELEQLRCLVDESGGEIAFEESGVKHKVDEEGKIRLDPADAEFLQTTFHAPRGINEAAPVRGDFNQERIVKRGDHRAAERRAGIQANAHAAGRAIVAQAPVVRNEAVGRVLRGDATLECKGVGLDGLLRCETDFRIG
jgi:hypothetical protein